MCSAQNLTLHALGEHSLLLTLDPTRAWSLPKSVVERDEALRFFIKRAYNEPNAGASKPGRGEGRSAKIYWYLFAAQLFHHTSCSECSDVS